MPPRVPKKPSGGAVKPSRFRIPNVPGGHGAVPKNNTYPIPSVRSDSIFSLNDVVGPAAATQIEATGTLSFHCIGDSGRGPDTNQQAVAEAMSRDINPANHEKSPAFLLHLGDVIYGDGKRDLYDDEFYRPYADYHNKIIAVPGNHDGEEGLTVDKNSLEAFVENFCAPPGKQPPAAVRFGSEMVNQPGVYWMLETKLLNVIGLYSNAAEDFGILADNAARNVKNIGDVQTKWLAKMLQRIKVDRAKGLRKALICAMHHPPYAQGLQEKGFGHPGSAEMLQQMDDVCFAAGIMPDAVLSGHTHCYARYMRRFAKPGFDVTIPYIVNGAGGHAVQPAPSNVNFTVGDVTYANGAPQKGLVPAHASDIGYGYLTVSVDTKKVDLAYTIVQGNHRQPFETTTVPLA
jgi:hypothetical protein